MKKNNKDIIQILNLIKKNSSRNQDIDKALAWNSN